MTYSYCTQNMSPEEEEKFGEEIGMRHDPVADAKAQLAAYQEAMGITFDDPDKPVPPDAKAVAWMADQEIDGAYMGQERRR